MNEQWIVVRNWDKFQHYKDREPPWIKDYTEQLDDPAWLELTGVQRATLQGLRLKYATSRRQIRDSTRLISRQLNMRVTRETLDALNDAGFIQYAASNPLAKRKRKASASRAREEGLRPEERLTSPERPAPKPAKPRPPDELWDALTEALGQEPATASERGRRNKALKELRAIGATPAEISSHADAFRTTWPNLTLTETGLVAHWSRFSNGPEPSARPRRYGRGVTAAEVLERAGLDMKELNE